MEQLQLSCTAGGNTKWHNYFGHMAQQSHFQEFTQEKWKYTYNIHTNLSTNVCSSFLVRARNWKQHECPSTGKHTVVYPYNGILFSNKKEWPADPHNDMGESPKHYVKALWKEPDSKGYIMYGILEEVKLQEQKIDQQYWGLGMRRGSFFIKAGGDRSILYLDCGDS